MLNLFVKVSMKDENFELAEDFEIVSGQPEVILDINMNMIMKRFLNLFIHLYIKIFM